MAQKLRVARFVLLGICLWAFFGLISPPLELKGTIGVISPPSPSYTLPYQPKVTAEDNPLGNLSINWVMMIAGVNDSEGNITTKWHNFTFIGSLSNASAMNAIASGVTYSSSINFSWYEYLEWSKWDLYAGSYGNYSSRIPRAQLISVEYNNSLGWSSLVPASESMYKYEFGATNDYPDRYFVNLSLWAMNDPAWNSSTTNATVLTRLKYSYALPVSNWRVLQNLTGPIPLINASNAFNQSYYETFRIEDSQVFDNFGKSLLNFSLTYTPNNKGQVYSLDLWAKKTTDSTYYDVPKGSWTLRNAATNTYNWTTNATVDVKIFFNGSFIAEFEEILHPLLPPHAVDRLAGDVGIRERWYFLNLTSGPDLLRVAGFVFNDTNIDYPSITSTTSYFGRNFTCTWNNYTAEGGTIINAGARFTFGYLVPGEMDVLIARYDAPSEIVVLIGDQTQTPVSGANVTLYRDGNLFGSYLSVAKNFTQPSKFSDNEGYVRFKHVPKFGNYTVRVAFFGVDYGFYEVAVTKSVNILKTVIPHLPVWILIWASFCGLLFVAGVIRYRRIGRQTTETEDLQ